MFNHNRKCSDNTNFGGDVRHYFKHCHHILRLGCLKTNLADIVNNGFVLMSLKCLHKA